MNIRTSSLTLAVSLSVLTLGWANTSHANHTFSECEITCESDCDDAGSGVNGSGLRCHEAEGGECILSANITCNSPSNPIVKLRDGMDLDLHGHTITCTNNVDCDDGVVMEHSSTKVYNGDEENEAGILGRFNNAVNCQLYGTTEVKGIRMENGIVGTRDCKWVHQNVMVGLGRVYQTGNWGVITNGVTASGDVIEDNYIADKASAVLVYGTDTVQVSNNVVHTTVWTQCGVNILDANATTEVLGNTFLGVGNQGFSGIRKIICLNATPPTGVDLAGNICDKDHPNCASCQTSGACTPFTAPFLP